jgi:EAL domain-containing protein (putative c-di-GMP-specific phosphodiesterase class I)
MDAQFKIFREIDQAINNDEFFLQYQPNIDIVTGKMIGFEALVRWNSNVLGIVYPDQFINVAEYTGQIIELGSAIIEKAMNFAHIISEIDNEIVVSINISPRQLLEDNFISKTVELIKKTKVNVTNIAFEVTETAYIENINRVNYVLKEITELGILIYLDDFGTGYSSLNYLNQLPIDLLKIDKSFIDDIHINKQSSNLTNTIIMMAKSLDLKCIAEGVEVYEQLIKLKTLGCENVQGYYFDKPMSEKDALNRVFHIYELESDKKTNSIIQ